MTIEQFAQTKNTYPQAIFPGNLFTDVIVLASIYVVYPSKQVETVKRADYLHIGDFFYHLFFEFVLGIVSYFSTLQSTRDHYIKNF